MRECDFNMFSLDEKHSPEDRKALEIHAASCAQCRQALEQWRQAESVLESNGALTGAGTPADIEVEALFERLRDRGPGAVGRAKAQANWKLAAVFGGAFALGMILTAVFYQSGDRAVELGPATQLAQAPVSVPVPVPVPLPLHVDNAPLQVQVIEAPIDAPLMKSLDQDRVGLTAASRLVVSEPDSGHREMVVDRGAVAFEVAGRQPGEQFVVKAADLTIRVVGTQFTVARENGRASVVVTEGVVEVRRGDLEEWTLTVGQKLAADEGGRYRVSPWTQADQSLASQLLPSMEPSDDQEEQAKEETPIDVPRGEKARVRSRENRLAEIKELFIAGEVERAQDGLLEVVEEHPSDYTSRPLLADYYKKSRDFEDSLAHYQAVVDGGPGRLGNRARFKAAQVLGSQLSRHVEAQALYRSFLANAKGSVLESTAMLGLAESLIETGDLEEAKTLLTHIAVHKGGSVAAVKARKILNELDAQ